MMLGNAAWGFRETALEKQLEITRAMELALLELSIAGHPNDRLQSDARGAQVAAVKKLFKKHGVELGCFATGNDFTLKDETACLAQLEHVKKVIDICHELGGGYLRIFAGFEPVGKIVGRRWRTMIECLTATADYCRGKNVVPVVETHGGVRNHDDGVQHYHSTSSKPDTLCRMLAELPDSVKVNFDPANLHAVGIKHPHEVYLRIEDRVACVHLKDFVRVPGSSHLRPAACGESDMDWAALAKAMQNYGGPALIEYENVEDIEDGCRRSLAFINRLTT